MVAFGVFLRNNIIPALVTGLETKLDASNHFYFLLDFWFCIVSGACCCHQSHSLTSIMHPDLKSAIKLPRIKEEIKKKLKKKILG